MYDTPLGFRHGPKSIINDETLTVVYISDQDYTRQYEIDLIKEMSGERKGNKIVAIMNKPSEEIERLCDYSYAFNDEIVMDNVILRIRLCTLCSNIGTKEIFSFRKNPQITLVNRRSQ